jgi:hypothetical protein
MAGSRRSRASIRKASRPGNLARFRYFAFGKVGGVAFDAAASKIYLSETDHDQLDVVSIVDPTKPRMWTIDLLTMSTPLRGPTGLFFDDATKLLYVVDAGNHAIRTVDPTTGVVADVVNADHRLGFAGDGGPAASALLYQPSAVTRCANGDLFIADTGNNRVRRVSNGVITTVLGDGAPASSGEGEPARIFSVDAPAGVTCDPFGNVFVTSSTTVRMVTANDQGVVDGSGHVQTIYGAPPRASFPASVTSCLTGISAVGPTTIEVADACSGLLVKLERAPKP